MVQAPYFSHHEATSHALLAAGARVPDRKPVLQAGDRGPRIAVAITIALTIAFIVYVALRQ